MGFFKRLLSGGSKKGKKTSSLDDSRWKESEQSQEPTGDEAAPAIDSTDPTIPPSVEATDVVFPDFISSSKNKKKGKKGGKAEVLDDSASKELEQISELPNYAGPLADAGANDPSPAPIDDAGDLWTDFSTGSSSLLAVRTEGQVASASRITFSARTSTFNWSSPNSLFVPARLIFWALCSVLATPAMLSRRAGRTDSHRAGRLYCDNRA